MNDLDRKLTLYIYSLYLGIYLSIDLYMSLPLPIAALFRFYLSPSFFLTYCTSLTLLVFVSLYRKFRVVDAETCLKYFSSDRSHMINSGMPFPTWPELRGELSETAMNLPNYWSMDVQDEERYGQVMTLKEFMEWSMPSLSS